MRYDDALILGKMDFTDVRRCYDGHSQCGSQRFITLVAELVGYIDEGHRPVSAPNRPLYRANEDINGQVANAGEH